MSNTTITKTYFFTATPETVWSFLTEKDKLAQWFHPATADLVAGEDYALVRDSVNGEEEKVCWAKVLEMDIPRKLVYTFTITPLDSAMTTVTWTLEEITGGTRLTLKHEGISKTAAGNSALGILMALDKGWDKHLDAMREAVNTPFKDACND